MQARDIMTTEVETASPDTTARDIAKRLLDRNISALPVVDGDGNIVGIVSEGDLMRRSETETERKKSWWLDFYTTPENRQRDFIRSHGQHAADIMTRKIVSITEDTPLAEISSTLEKHHIKRAPVLRDGKLVGIVSRADLLRGLATSNPDSVPNADDRELKAAIEDAGKQAGVDMFFITVAVKDGQAQIWGMTETQHGKKAMRVAAESVPGVKAVENNVSIMPEMVRTTMWAE
tara:strand:+ start:601 stop:1299 length:699 start_codon:yes stop_codon:yes gene_type:complete